MTTRRELAGVAALHAALASLSFARLLAAPGDAALARSLFDLASTVWVQWWGPFAALRGLDPFSTSWVYHPAVSRLAVDADLPRWLLSAPLGALFGPLGAHHALAVFSYAATGAACYALLRRFSASIAGCLLGSFAFAYSSYRGYALLSGHGEMLQTQWGVLLGARRSRTAPRRATAADALAAAAWRANRPTRARPSCCRPCAATGAYATRAQADAAALARRWPSRPCCSPPPARRGRSTRCPLSRAGGVAAARRVHDGRAARVLAWPAHHALRQLGAAPPASGWPEAAAGYLGPAFLVLAAFGAWSARRRPERRPLLLVAAAFLLLAAFPSAVTGLPVVSFLRVPARFMFGATLAGAALAAWGWEAAAARVRRRGAARPLGGLRGGVPA